MLGVIGDLNGRNVSTVLVMICMLVGAMDEDSLCTDLS